MSDLVAEFLDRQEQRQPDVRARWASLTVDVATALGMGDPLAANELVLAEILADIASMFLLDPTLPERLPFPPA